MDGARFAGLAAEAGSPKRSVLGWLLASAAALALLVGALGVVAADDGDAHGTGAAPTSPDGWETLESPPLPPDAMADGGVTLAAADGRLLAVSDGDGVRPGQVWVLDGGPRSGPVAVPGPPRSQAAVVGTPQGLVVWGGRTGEVPMNDGYAYDPASRHWRPLAPSPLPPSPGAIGVWTGQQVVLVAGAEAAAYDPVSHSWSPPSADYLAGATVMAAAGAGGRAVVWAYDEATGSSRLLALDAGAATWAALPPPPFDPGGGTSGLAADPAGLIATSTEFGAAAAAVLDRPDGGWRTLAAPPVRSDVVCPSELAHGGAGTVLLSRCSGELFLLDGDAWRRLPPLPDAAAGARPGAQAVVTGDAVYYLAAGAEPSLLRLALG